MHKFISLVGVLGILVVTGCSDDGDTTGDGAVKKEAGGGLDALLWPDAKLKLDSKPWPCTGKSTTECGGKKTMFCEGGFCKPCPIYYYNCDKLGVCECAGACDGATCVGTKITCSSTEKDVCGKDTTQYCKDEKCTNCPAGTGNCDSIGDCECTGTCDKNKCIGTATKCKFDDKDVCGGDTKQYCDKDKCVPCPPGTLNCDKTKDCECTGKCAGPKCL